jgi:hypothetical protein
MNGVPRLRQGAAITLAGACLLAACSKGAREHPIITAYVTAECVPPTWFSTNGSQPVRYWKTEVARPRGGTFVIRAIQAPGGQLFLENAASGTAEFFAPRSDYVLPADVRLDRARGHVYVKLVGVDAFLPVSRTILTDVDLKGPASTSIVVEPSVLPPECAMNKSAR